MNRPAVFLRVSLDWVYTLAMPKYFTISEANRALLILRPMMKEMMAIAEKIRSRQPELWSLVEKSAGNGGNVELSKMLPDFDKLDALLHQVQDMGVQVKDLTSGLVDFVALREGREVYLCWKYDEESVQFWHEIDAGFAGRRPISTF